MYQHLFGPVPSRRLGSSLGVDLVTHKICTLDCVYCECGKTTDLTVERKEYVNFKDVVKELEHFFKNNPDPDYITFSGSGEPCLNIHIGKVISYIKQQKPGIKVAVLTNGTLLSLKDTRKDLSLADIVIPSLDAAVAHSFVKINRPCPKIDLKTYLNGIVTFSKEFNGEIWLEILILQGFNDSKQDISALKQAVKDINPDLVQLNTLDRPGTVSGIRPADRQGLEKIKQLLDFHNISIVAKAKNKPLSGQRKDARSTIMETIHRRPCTAQDLLEILGIDEQDLKKILQGLEKEGKIEIKKEERGIFYQTIKK
ncbi:MAG: radical SAM protein [Desulfobacteraceae bacterium]|nr:radical SAM protein [Desulfobacteraceae bacterium]